MNKNNYTKQSFIVLKESWTDNSLFSFAKKIPFIILFVVAGFPLAMAIDSYNYINNQAFID